MRLASRWIRVLFGALALAAAVATVTQFAASETVLLASDDSNKGGGG
jgi:hypothetical protein